ncbi:MAG: hypothetical protein DMG05_23610 [Acidobacteria bacterium]|nr:MAG: hypothetical protein DMG05_23610 [Acidobacteriota bacterium]
MTSPAKNPVAVAMDSPMPSNTAEALAALGGIKRIPLAWFLWTEDGEQPVVMKVSKPVTVQSHCCQQWGLATGPNTVFKANSFPLPNLDLTLSKPFKVELMRRLDAAEAEAKSLLTFFSPHFDLLEDVALRAKQDHASRLELRQVLNAFYGASIGSARQPVPLRLHSAFRSRKAVNGRTLFHVEVFKEYPAASCTVVAYSSCWISKDPMGTLTLLNQNGTSVGFFDCDWKGAAFFTPFMFSDKATVGKVRGTLFSKSSTTRSVPCCRWREEGVKGCSDPPLEGAAGDPASVGTGT